MKLIIGAPKSILFTVNSWVNVSYSAAMPPIFDMVPVESSVITESIITDPMYTLTILIFAAFMPSTAASLETNLVVPPAA